MIKPTKNDYICLDKKSLMKLFRNIINSVDEILFVIDKKYFNHLSILFFCFQLNLKHI